MAEQLTRRLADLRAASSVADLVVGQPCELPDNPQQYTLSLSDGYRIVLCANHRGKKQSESGDIDWETVSRVKILQIERV